MGSRGINARTFRSTCYSSPAPNQGWKLLNHKVILPGLCDLFFLDWNLSHSVQLLQPFCLCQCFNLPHQFSSIISSIKLSEESHWGWSSVYPGPITPLFPMLSSWRRSVQVGEPHLLSVCPCLHMGICLHSKQHLFNYS